MRLRGNGFFLVATKNEVVSFVLMHGLPVMPNLLALRRVQMGWETPRNDWFTMDYFILLFSHDSCKHDYDCVDITERELVSKMCHGLCHFCLWFCREFFVWSVPCCCHNDLSNIWITAPCCLCRISVGNCGRVPWSVKNMLSGSWQSVPCFSNTISYDGFSEP